MAHPSSALEAGQRRSPLVVIGGGEHARVVIETARTAAEPWEVRGYTAPQPSADPAPAAPYLGTDDALLAGADADAATSTCVLGFGGGESSGDLVRRLGTAAHLGPEARWATVVHATAWVAPSAELEPGVVVLAHAVVNSGARVGRHAIVNSGAVVEHDCVIGPGTHLAPGAVVGGGTRIGEAVFVGLGARIRDHVEVGDGAVVGMGAVVVASVAPGARVVGVPARTGDEPR